MASDDERRKYPPLVLDIEEIAFLVQHPNIPGRSTVQGLPSGEPQAIAVAIAMAESGGDVYALNDNPATRDLSYGLWQINMYGDNEAHRKQLYGLNDNRQLYMADLNAAIMIELSRGGRQWTDWSVYNNGMYRAYLPRAREAIKFPRNPDAKLTSPQEKEERADTSALDNFLKWVESGVLRIGTFIGGGALVILAIVLYVKGRST